MVSGAQIVRELSRPEAYPGPVEKVGLLQTHISLLFFAGERVYKVKKAVDLGFLDFTTLERRAHFCEEEVRLNRRLAADVYLGVVPIVRSQDGHLRVGGTGEAVEWAVEMVRLPDHRMFSNLLDRGEIDNAQMNAMVSLLADFHARCPTGAGVDEHGSPAAVAANVGGNFEKLGECIETSDSTGLRVLTSRQFEFLRDRSRTFLEQNRQVFERRVSEGRIREGHGDLHAGNLCFAKGTVVAYDCIEFSRRFRCGDVASELAFLAMDLDYRGYPGFSGYLVKRYAQASDDAELPALLNFYKGYRALVRAKVASLTAADAALEEARGEELRREAMRYVHLAAAYELPPAMILICGLPASGKSWLAKGLASALRAVVLRSDVRRKVLSGIPPTTHIQGAYEAGLYSPEMKEKTYRSLLGSALENLLAGHSVIVDATFSKRTYRSAFVDAAARLDLPYYVVHVSAPEAVIRERMERRKGEKGEASDADFEVYLHARSQFEPPEEVPQAHVLEVASGESAPEEQSSLVIDRMIVLREQTADGSRE